MTNCKIGKVRFKSGDNIIPIKNTNLTLHTSKDWLAYNHVGNLMKEGRVQSIAIVCMYDNGTVYTDFNKMDDIKGTSVLGSVEMLKNFVLNWIYQ